MSGLKAVRYLVLVLAASVLAAGALAACGSGGGNVGASGGNVGVSGNVGGSGGSVGDSGSVGGSVGDSGSSGSSGSVGDSGSSGSSGDSGSSGSSGSGGSGGSSVTGTVTWPDGHLAANASVFFNNHDPGFSGSGWSQGQNGNWYQQQQLPANGSYSLTGCPCGDLTAYLYVPAAVMSQANGGWDCWIIMQDDNQNYSGLQANPGAVINWQALNMLCSRTFYTSDQATVQSEQTTVLPSLNAGTWQTAEQLTTGG